MTYVKIEPVTAQTQTDSRRRSLPLASAPAPNAQCCPGIGVATLEAEQAEQIAPLFKALGDPVRLRLMSIIAASVETCVCDLTDAFALSAPTISHHLRVLREAGLVDAERRGTWVYYRARPEVLRTLAGLLLPDPVEGASGSRRQIRAQ